jgi:ArsR family transcriptional regulator, cadmium/lead-responsive transcriptional repressor
VTDRQAVFAALADPTRRQMLDRLVSDGPATATALASEFPMSRQAVAKHLAVLHDAGLVERAVVGREAQFQATPEALGDVRSWIDQVGSQWDQRLGRLRDRLD